MATPPLEIMDWVETPLGPLCLRRRQLLSRPGTVITEVTLDHELLMSSWHTRSEEALATRAVRYHGGAGLRALVGGLGLGYTAHAALASGQVDQVRVVELLPAVIRWLREGLLPLSASLGEDPRLELHQGDVYAELLGPAPSLWDLILIDVDHSPTEPLGPGSEPFYTAPGLRQIARHLAPGGVLAVWSTADSEPFRLALAAVFPETSRESVAWINELVDEERPQEEILFLARQER